MTNSPFDDVERPVWEREFSRDIRFFRRAQNRSAPARLASSARD